MRRGRGVFKMTTKVRVLADNLPAMRAGLKLLEDEQVLVGVPAEKAPRTSAEAKAKGMEINNAALAYIHNYGSPANNIPARPFLEPGIENAKDSISTQMQKAGDAAMAGKRDAVHNNLEAVGLMASTSVKMKIRTGPFAPLGAATIRARERRAGHALGPGDIRPLIDTGQMLNSITYVIRKKR